MLYFFRVLIILLKGIIPRFASVISMVWLVSPVSFRSFRWFRFGGFVSVVSLVSVVSFRFVVSGFSTCHHLVIQMRNSYRPNLIHFVANKSTDYKMRLFCIRLDLRY